MKDLTIEARFVFTARSLEEKKIAMKRLVELSHAKLSTKERTLNQLQTIMSTVKMDAFAANYLMKGEGLGVI